MLPYYPTTIDTIYIFILTWSTWSTWSTPYGSRDIEIS
nr:MAG TPA: hypothetical protein [Caudoviricetes sp.]